MDNVIKECGCCAKIEDIIHTIPIFEVSKIRGG